jgi:hypothetical protein
VREGCAPFHTPPLPQRREKYILQACQKLKRKTIKKRNAKWCHYPSLSGILAESAGCLFSATLSRDSPHFSSSNTHIFQWSNRRPRRGKICWSVCVSAGCAVLVLENSVLVFGSCWTCMSCCPWELLVLQSAAGCCLAWRCAVGAAVQVQELSGVEEGAAHAGRLVLGDGLLSCRCCPSLEEVLPGVEKCCRCCYPSTEGATECCPSAVQAWRKVLPMRGEAVQQLQVLSRCAQFQLLSIWCCPAGLSFAFIYIFFLTLAFSHFIYEMPHLSN